MRVRFFQHQCLKPIKDTPLRECACAHKYILPGSIFGSRDSPSALEWIMQDRDSPWLLRSSPHTAWAAPCVFANMPQWGHVWMQIYVRLYGSIGNEMLKYSNKPSNFSTFPQH